MKLAEDLQVVEALKQILEDYDYLEYDKTWPYLDELHVKVTDSKANRNHRVVIGIRDKLEDVTNRKFSSPRLSNNDDLNEEWTEFILYKVNGNEVNHP